MLFCLFTFTCKLGLRFAWCTWIHSNFYLKLNFFNNLGFITYLLFIHSFIHFGNFIIPQLHEVMGILCFPISVEDIVCGIFLSLAQLISLFFCRSLGRLQNYAAMVIPPPTIKNGFGFVMFGHLYLQKNNKLFCFCTVERVSGLCLMQ